MLPYLNHDWRMVHALRWRCGFLSMVRVFSRPAAALGLKQSVAELNLRIMAIDWLGDHVAVAWDHGLVGFEHDDVHVWRRGEPSAELAQIVVQVCDHQAAHHAKSCRPAPVG